MKDTLIKPSNAMVRGYRYMVKIICIVILSFSLTSSFGQFKPKGKYVGIVPLKDCCSPDKPQYKWYHLSELIFKGDSVYLEQSPIAIYKGDTIFSASDGGFYTYSGIIQKYKGKTIASLTLLYCEYCPMQMVRFNPPKIIDDYDTSTVTSTDTLPNLEEPKEIENPRIKYKTIFIEATKNGNTILVDKNIFRRQKK